MTALVIAEHDHGTLKAATLNTITAALQCGGEVHLLVAGHSAAGAVQAAAQIAGVSKVLHADAPQLAEQPGENIADQGVGLANGRIAAQGTPAEVRASTDPLVHQFVNALADGPVRLHYPGPDVEQDFGVARGGEP